MLSIRIAIVISLLASQAAFASQTNCAQNVGQLSSSQDLGDVRESTMEIWRYVGRPDFNSVGLVTKLKDSNSLGFSSGSEGIHSSQQGFSPVGWSLLNIYANRIRFVPDPIRSEIESGSRGSNLLERNQHYSLVVMEQKEYINEQLRLSQDGVSLKLHPNQVTFFELSEKRTHESLIKEFGKIPEHAKRDPVEQAVSEYFNMFAWDEEPNAPKTPVDPDAEKVYTLKSGTSWLISGQFFESRFRLPLETADLAVPLDRAKYPRVWEVGRAAQSHAEGFEETLRGDVYFAFLEMALMGGKLDECYIFGRALEKRRALVFKRIYGMKDYSTYSDHPAHSVTVIPLKELLQRVDLAKFSSGVRQLIRNSSGIMNPIAALTFLIRGSEHRNRYLENADEAVFVRDFSTSVFKFDESLRLGLGRTLSETLRHKVLYQDFALEHAERSVYPYVTPILGTKGLATPYGAFQKGRNIIEINIVSAEPKLSSTQYLVAVLRDQRNRLLRAGIQNPDQWMKDQNLEFHLVGRGQITANQGKDKPVDRWVIHRNELISAHQNPFFNFREVLRPEIHLEVLAYSAHQILEMERQLATNEKVKDFKKGRVHAERFLQDPELFNF
ncbi:MAG: hypothetical protein IT289_10560 [Oligoflexia bacterium]|nr:hypothetical protein [Oligoflexia bacterium]